DGVALDHFFERGAQIVALVPAGVPFGEPPCAADPPDVIAGSRRVDVGPPQPLAGDLFTEPNRFEHRTTAEAPAAHVVDLAKPRVAIKVIDRVDVVVAVDVVADLLGLVPKNGVRQTFNHAPHQICEEAVKLYAGMVRPCQAAAAKTSGLHPEIAS